jgi:conjugal transfer/entry exclusion protein
MAAKATFSLVLIAAALIAGCGQSKAEKAKANVCDARADMAKQVKTLQGLTLGTATTSQVTDSLKAIQKDLKTIGDNSGDLTAQFKQDVQSANDQFKSSVQDTASNLGKTVSVKSAATQLQTAFQQLATSYQTTFGKLKC